MKSFKVPPIGLCPICPLGYHQLQLYKMYSLLPMHFIPAHLVTSN